MEGAERGNVVREQAADTSVMNTDPALVKGAVVAVVGFIGGVGAIFVVMGRVTPDEVKGIQDQATIIIPAGFAILSIVQAVWTRSSVWSPRTAARSAVESAKSGVPTLAGPV